VKKKLVAAYHEAGHAVVARLLGIRVKHLTIIPDRDCIGGVLHEKIIRGVNPENEDSPRTQRPIENSVRIALAGHIAQKSHSPRSHYGAGADHEGTTRLALAVNNGSTESAKAWLKWLKIGVTAMLKRYWNVVDAVAQELAEQKFLNSEQFEAIWTRALAIRVPVARSQNGLADPPKIS
jgi:hypothetical protein